MDGGGGTLLGVRVKVEEAENLAVAGALEFEGPVG